MVRGDDKAVATLREVTRLLEGPSDGQGFPLNGGVPRFGAVVEPRAGEGDVPSRGATKRGLTRA